jgi:predicted nucleic-acid-binding protein
MKAIDTNILVRFLVRDDAQQARRARKLIEVGGISIPKTVLLETEWVLRYTYEFDRIAVNRALGKVCGLPQIVIEDTSAVIQALSWHADGFDFADALHLVSSRDVQAFYTFDRSLVKKAGKAETIPVETP